MAGALGRMTTEGPLVVALHPEDLQLRARRIDGKPPSWAGGEALRLVDDAALARGACRVEGPQCELLVDSDLLLEELRQFLLDRVSRCSD